MSLGDIITDQTYVIDLKKQPSDCDRRKIIELPKNYPSIKEQIHLDKIYEWNDNYYYFKSNSRSITPMMNELLGSHISKKIELDTVKFLIARRNNDIGLASLNFKDNTKEYIYPKDLTPCLINTTTIINIDNLCSMCINQKNKDIFKEHLWKFLSLDILMLQRDRHVNNVQFTIDRKTHFFDLGTAYDFSACKDKIGDTGLDLCNIIIYLNLDTIRMLIKKYGEFYDILKSVLEVDIPHEVEVIGQNYNLNTDSYQFQNVIDYYEIRQNKQKKYMKTFINSIQK